MAAHTQALATETAPQSESAVSDAHEPRADNHRRKKRRKHCKKHQLSRPRRCVRDAVGNIESGDATKHECGKESDAVREGELLERHVVLLMGHMVMPNTKLTDDEERSKHA